MRKDDASTVLQERMRSRRIPALDGMRALAVSLVVLYHGGFESINGATGVLLFFVLSGFLITWLLLSEQESTSRVALGAFYKRRVLRLYPPLLLYVVLDLAVWAYSHRRVDPALVVAVLGYYSNYYQGLVPVGQPAFASHTWSLGVEEQFYVLWPLAVIAWRGNLRSLARFTAAAILGVWFYRAALHLGGVNEGYIYRAFDTRLDQMLMGCLAAVVIKGSMAPVWVGRLSSRPWYPAISFGLLLLSSMVLQPWDESFTYRHLVAWTIEPLLVAVLLIQVIVACDRTPWSVLESRPLRYIGVMSYSIYLYHPLTLLAGHRLMNAYGAAAQLVAGLAVTLAFAAASFVFVERPFSRRFRQESTLGRSSNPSARPVTTDAGRAQEHRSGDQQRSQSEAHAWPDACFGGARGAYGLHTYGPASGGCGSVPSMAHANTNASASMSHCDNTGSPRSGQPYPMRSVLSNRLVACPRPRA
jgi:peptidoglycan/LPS O-acetylase OafA/YrhL